MTSEQGKAWQDRAELAESETERLNAVVEDLREQLERMTANARRLDRARSHVMAHLSMVTGRNMPEIVSLIESAGGVT